MNEEKDPKWFVWERSSHGVCGPAVYRGLPTSGTGLASHDHRFAFKVQLPPEDQNLSLDDLKAKYPCPEGEVSTYQPRQAANLSKGSLE
jgi:hypothetical protein